MNFQSIFFSEKLSHEYFSLFISRLAEHILAHKYQMLDCLMYFVDILMSFWFIWEKRENHEKKATKTCRHRWYVEERQTFSREIVKNTLHISRILELNVYALLRFFYMAQLHSYHIHTVLCVSCWDWIIELLCCVISTANSCSEPNWALFRHCTTLCVRDCWTFDLRSKWLSSKCRNFIMFLFCQLHVWKTLFQISLFMLLWWRLCLPFEHIQLLLDFCLLNKHFFPIANLIELLFYLLSTQT